MTALRLSVQDAVMAMRRGEAIDLASVEQGELPVRGFSADVAFTLHRDDAGEVIHGEGADPKKLPSFSIVAYTGAPVRQWWSRVPLVVDLAGMRVTQKGRPVVADHTYSHDQVIGHTTLHANDGRTLTVGGVVSGVDDSASRVVKLAGNGFPWQASIGATILKVERVEAGAKVQVNGRTIEGPVDVIRQSTLDEVSFVVLGADDETTAHVAARRANHQDQESTMTQLSNGTAGAGAGAIEASATTPVAPQPTGNASDLSADARVNAERMKIAAEYQRISDVTDELKRHPSLLAKAVAEGWSKEKAQLEAMRADRPAPAAPNVIARGGRSGFGVLAAAVMLTANIPGLEKLPAFAGEGARDLDAAAKEFKHGIGLQELLIEAANQNGASVRSYRSDPKGVIQAAFSTNELSNILANTANKLLLEGFNSVEQSWRSISSIRPVRDFKQVTAHRLIGDGVYEEIGAGGKIPAGTLGSKDYANQAKTYGKLIGITRTDIINDDLGALTGAATRLGIGGALKFNDVFWTVFLDNATFFASGNSNYFEGASTNLSVSSLGTAETTFMNQTTPEGKPLGMIPGILLVPPALAAIARTLFTSQLVQGSTAKETANNAFAGMYQPVVSAYLGNSSYTGYSSTAWYLLALPSRLAVIEACFLNGQQNPTIETVDGDADELGITLRGYHDFGVAKQEFRAGVKSKGAA